MTTDESEKKFYDRLFDKLDDALSQSKDLCSRGRLFHKFFHMLNNLVKEFETKGVTNETINLTNMFLLKKK